MDELDQKVQEAAAESHPLLRAIYKVFKEVQKSLSDSAAAVNRHAEGLEGHHASLYSAQEAFLALKTSSFNFEKTVKIEVEGAKVRIGTNENLLNNTSKEMESVRNKLLNMESNMSRCKLIRREMYTRLAQTSRSGLCRHGPVLL